MKQGILIRALGLAALTGAASLLAPWGAGAQPLAPTPTLGPVVEVDRPVFVGAVGDQTVPAAVYLGSGTFLVVWRTSLWEGEVRAARVTADGQLREPRGVPLPGLEGNDAKLAVAAGGGSIVVVGAAETRLQAIRLAGVIEDVHPLVPGAPALLAATPGEELGRPAVAWNGFELLGGMVPERGLGSWRCGSTRRDSRSTLLPCCCRPRQVTRRSAGMADAPWPPGRRSTPGAWWCVRPGSTATAGGWTLRRWSSAQISGARAGPTAVASNGSVFLVAAAGEGGADGAAVVGAIRLAQDGRALDPSAIALAQLAGPPEGGPTAIWNGTRFVVLWGESTGQAVSPTAPRVVSPEGRLVGADGAVSALGLPGLGAAGEQPVAVAGEGKGLVFLARPPGGKGDLDIRGVVLGEEGGAAGADFLVSAGLNWQGNPALAAGGPAADRRMLVAWEDARADRLNRDIFASLLDATGAPLEPAAIPLATGTAAQRAPSVAWDGRAFQAVWHEHGRGLVATRVAMDGTVIDRPALLVPGTAGGQALSDPVLCGDDAGALLVWSARRQPGAAGAPRAELRAVRIAPGATVRDGQSVAVLATHDVSAAPAMRLSCAADAALLIWTGLYEMDRSSFPDLQMALIPRGGEPITPRVTLLERGAADEGPAVASDGRGFLVAWRPRQMGGARVDIFGTRVDPTGVGIDRPARALGSLNAGHRVSVYWDGSQYVMVGIQSLAVGNFQMRARRVRADLGALDADWFPIAKVSSLRGTGSLPIALAVGAGAAVVVSEAFLDDDATSNQRLRAHLLRTPPLEPTDGGSAGDGGLAPDAGAPAGDLPAKARGGGCACSVEPAPVAPALWAVLLVGLLWRRRRARSRP